MNNDENKTSSPMSNPLLQKAAMSDCAQKKKNRPSWDIRFFVAGASALLFLQMVCHVYYVGVVRTLERRFGLQSRQTGLINSCNDIMTIFVVIAVGYFGGRSNKPRVISVFCMIFAIGAFIFASPYFIFPSRTQIANGVSVQNKTNSTEKLCVASGREVVMEDVCKLSERRQGEANYAAFLVFIMAQLFIGFGGSATYVLGLSYIDENSSKTKSPIYLGITTSMFAFGPMCAHLLAAFSTRLPEDLFSDTNLTPSDPAWIGCWWLGFMIVGVGILSIAAPMYFFPPHLPRDDDHVEDDEDVDAKIIEKKKEESLITQIKEFPRALWSLLTNVAFLLRVAGAASGIYLVIGVFSNVPRFLEIHYHLPTFKANSYSAIHSFAGFAGGLGGGIMLSRLKMTPIGAAKFIIFLGVFTLCGIGTAATFSCPQENMYGDWSDSRHSLLIQNSCNQNCSCETSSSVYSPVCGSDGMSYFSACHAGCTQFNGSTFSDCRCAPGGEVKKGYCIQGCDMLAPYLVVFFITCIVGSMRHVPSLIVQFRVVKPHERSLSMSVNGFCINLLGFIPGPIIFGSLIDSTCLLWQRTCGKKGVCRLFDIAQFRVRTYGAALLFMVLSTLFSVALWWVIRKKSTGLDDNVLTGDEDGETRIGSSSFIEGDMDKEPSKNKIDSV